MLLCQFWRGKWPTWLALREVHRSHLNMFRADGKPLISPDSQVKLRTGTGTG
jgi:hypothetical protein